MGHKKLVLSNPDEDYPDFLLKVSRSQTLDSKNGSPTLVNMSKDSGEADLRALIQQNPGVEVIDNYGEQFAELVLSKNAHLYRANYDVQVASIEKLLHEHYSGLPSWRLGSWVFFPWKNQLVHILAQRDFEALRTIRNRDLITADEQERLFNFEAATFGMSVGSAGALALGITGISRRLKLIDGAVISGSNLNRILTGVSSVGKSKALVIGQQIYEMNPYVQISYFDKVTSENIDEIFEKPWPIKLAIDEIDDIRMKVQIRVEARKRKLPVLMATELGDTVMLDVERYDLEPNRALFHGFTPGIETTSKAELENYREWTKRAVKIIGPHNMPMKMQKSLLKIGTSVVTHPQLGSTVMITGGILAFAAKNIALGEPLESGRYIISLEGEMLASHKTRTYRRQHKKHTKVIHSAIDAM